MDIFALIPLKLDHLSHLGIGNDCAIASLIELVQEPCLVRIDSRLTELLLNDLEDLLLIYESQV